MISTIPALQLQAQFANIRFDYLSVENGLSNDVVYSIAQDKRGFLWIGTEDRLNRYDGYQFVIFENDPQNPQSISSNSASHVFCDSRGELWIGTWGGGLNRFDPETETFHHYTHNAEDSTSISDTRIQTIFEDRSGTLWFGCFQGGLNRLDRAAGQFIRYQFDSENPNSLSNNRVWKILEDQKGNLWIATQNGLNYFDKQQQTFTRYHHDPYNPASVNDRQIRTLAIDRSGTLWAGTRRGVSRFDPVSNTFVTILPIPGDPENISNRINSIFEDDAGTLWLGTMRGLFHFSKSGECLAQHYADPLNPNSLSHNDIRCIFKDKTGIFWLGTRGGGLIRFNPSLRFTYWGKNYNDPGRLTSHRVRAILQDKNDNVWIGSNGLSCYSMNKQKYTHYNHDSKKPKSLSHNFVTSIFEDQNDEIWIGTEEGWINHFDSARQQFNRYKMPIELSPLTSNALTCIHEDTQNRFWIGMDGSGLLQWNHKTGKLVHHFQFIADDSASINHNEISTLFEDSKHRFWVGTDKGLNLLKEDNTFQRFDLGTVYAFSEDENGIIWFGSRNGLYKMQIHNNPHSDNVHAEFSLYTKEDGLPNNIVYGILKDNKGRLWLSTDFGLSRFNPANNKFVNYDKADGLQGNRFHSNVCFKNRNGVLFFGGTNGVNSFDPMELPENTLLPDVVISRFSIFEKPAVLEKPVSMTQKINLSHKDNYFSFTFSALDFTKPGKNQYQYRMDPFDKDWINAGTRNYASYTNLDPGQYIFHVKGANSDGLWNTADTSIKLSIAPPWWETMQFRLFLLLLIIACIAAVYRWRVLAFHRYSRRLENEVNFRTRALADSNQQLAVAIDKAKLASQAKSQFLASVSHELRTPLNAVLGFSEILADEVKEPQYQTWINSIQSSGKTLLNLINDVLDLSKIEAGKMTLHQQPMNLKACIDEIIGLFSEKTRTKIIALKSRCYLDHQLVLDEHRIRQILLNLISNAVKFTEQGHVSVMAHWDENNQNTLTLIIEDSGIGIPIDQQEKIFEAFEQKEGQDQSQFSGTGLGLAITRNIVTLMGGTISLKSRVHQGSQFIIRIPGVKKAPGLTGTQNREAPVYESLQFLPASILIVDDIQLNRALLKKYLAFDHLTLFEAANGHEAIDLINQHAFDLIITDIKMPGLNGYELGRITKKRKTSASVPVIGLTAAQINRDDSPIHVFDALLLKPVSKKELLNVVLNYLDCIDNSDNSFSDRNKKQMQPAESPSISFKQRSELLTILEKDIMPQWENTKYYSIDQTETFAASIRKLAAEYAEPVLDNWVMNLNQAISTFDINTIQEILLTLPDLIESLKPPPENTP